MAKKKIDLTDSEAQAIINSFVGFDPLAKISAKQNEEHSNGTNHFDMEQDKNHSSGDDNFNTKQDEQLQRIISKKKGNKHFSLFLNKESDMMVKNGTSIRIRNKHHRKIRQIVQVIGSDKINIVRYIDNVLSHHLNKYEDEIIELYNIKPTFDEDA